MEKRGKAERQERAGRLRMTRKSKGMTQEAFAETIGVSVKAYKAVEQGENNCSLDLLTKLHDNLDISSDHILFGEDVKMQDAYDMVCSCTLTEQVEIWTRLTYSLYFEADCGQADKFTFEEMFKKLHERLAKEE